MCTDFVHDLLVVTELNVSDLGEAFWENAVKKMGRLGYRTEIKCWQALIKFLVYRYPVVVSSCTYDIGAQLFQCRSACRSSRELDALGLDVLVE